MISDRRYLLEACGLGCYWGWCYSLWLIPGVYINAQVVLPSQSASWLSLIISSTFFLFFVPACMGKVHLLQVRGLKILAPLLTCLGTVLLETEGIIASCTLLWVFGGLLAGTASAFLRHLWGDYFATTSNGNTEQICLGFGIVTLPSAIVCSLSPEVVSDVFVALLPILSGLAIVYLSRGTDAMHRPPLLPRITRVTSMRAVLKVCLIIAAVDAICEFVGAIGLIGDLPLGYNAMEAGVGAGALLLLAMASLSLALKRKLSVEKILSWTLFFAVVSLACIVENGNLTRMAAYTISQGCTVVFDVLLTTYFTSLVVKGYLSSYTAFGYSGGFVSLGMFVGNLSYDWLYISGRMSAYNTQMIGLVLICVTVALLIVLDRQSNNIDEIMTSPIEVSEYERNCASIAEQFSLTPREHEVLAMLGQGYSPQTIAKRLVLAPDTVRSHVKHIYQKLDIHSRSELIDYTNLGKGDASIQR